jgi:hypothetical protein
MSLLFSPLAVCPTRDELPCARWLAGVGVEGGGGEGGEGGGGSHASSLRTLFAFWGLRIAEVADPATRI